MEILYPPQKCYHMKEVIENGGGRGWFPFWTRVFEARARGRSAQPSNYHYPELPPRHLPCAALREGAGGWRSLRLAVGARARPLPPPPARRQGGVSVAELHEHLAPYAATCDYPSCLAWKQQLEAFPDAKARGQRPGCTRAQHVCSAA